MTSSVGPLNPLILNMKANFSQLLQKVSNKDSQVFSVQNSQSIEKNTSKIQQSENQSEKHEDHIRQEYSSEDQIDDDFNIDFKTLEIGDELQEMSERKIIYKQQDNQKAHSEKFVNSNINNIKEIQETYHFLVSNTQVFPNVLFTHRRNGQVPNKRSSIDSRYKQSSILSGKSVQFQRSSNPSESCLSSHKLFENRNSQKAVDKNRHQFSRFADKDQQKVSAESKNQCKSVVQSLFQIEDNLNDAFNYLRENKILELQQYLYDFKVKFMYLSDRMEIKWRLLMAYCKEAKKQFERASILYEQVIQISENSPKSLIIDSGDVYHRLGICYTEIRKWNQGIIMFSEALKEWKKHEKRLKYAQCLNNLGILYLSAKYISQAEHCFLMSMEIKKTELPFGSTKIISTLINLYECNFLTLNYEQAENVLKQIQSHLSSLKQGAMLKAGVFRRRGKLLLMKGQIQSSKNFYLRAMDILKKHYSYSLQYAELCYNLALLKIEENYLSQAQQLLVTSLNLFMFYYCKQSIAIRNVKSTLETVNNLLHSTENK